jgi:hypothetical protein
MSQSEWGDAAVGATEAYGKEAADDGRSIRKKLEHFLYVTYYFFESIRMFVVV